MTIGSRTIGIVIVAAGRGERAGSAEEGPKQYRRIGDKPVIAHTLERFLTWPRSGPIVVVIHPDDKALFAAAAVGIDGAGGVLTTFGGDTRQRSVYEGLRALSGTEATHVMIHDAARPSSTTACLTGWRKRSTRGRLGCCRPFPSATR